jgi:hypothetical protein
MALGGTKVGLVQKEKPDNKSGFFTRMQNEKNCINNETKISRARVSASHQYWGQEVVSIFDF